MKGPVQQEMEALLSRAFSPIDLRVINESDQHAGHAGGGQESHFQIHMSSELFRGLKSLERHRRVHSVLRCLLDAGLHALTLKLYAPGEILE